MKTIPPDVSVPAAHKPETHFNQCYERRDRKNPDAILILGEIKDKLSCMCNYACF